MPTTHDGHRRTRAVGFDLFALVLLGVVVFTATSLVSGLPGYAPAAITVGVLVVVWFVLNHRHTHPPHRGGSRTR